MDKQDAVRAELLLRLCAALCGKDASHHNIERLDNAREVLAEYEIRRRESGCVNEEE